MPIVDAHPHIYSSDRSAYPTIEEPWEPGEPASAEDLKITMDAVGVDRAVFIQTSTFYGHDNRYVMDSAKEHSGWATGVVTLDPDDVSHVDLLEDAVTNSNIRGMRGTSDSMSRISSPNVYRLWTKAMTLGIPVNCMVMDDLDRVPEIERIAQDLGDLKIVIDHCFMLNTRHRAEETLLALERLSALPNIYAKLTSGTHGSYRVYPHVDMHAPLKRVIDAFSPARCVWGSNFPNALWSRGTSYAQNLHLFVKELGLALPDKAEILGGTAMALWFPGELTEATRRAREQAERTEREVIRAQESENVADEVEEDDSPNPNSREAQVNNIAYLINAQDEAPEIAQAEDDEADIAEIIDVANELNAMLGTPDKHSADVKPAKKPRQKPSVAPAAEPASPVDVSELLAAQNYEPIEIGELEMSVDARDGDLDITALSDVADQLSAMLGSVDSLASEASDIAGQIKNEKNAAESNSEDQSSSA